MPNRILREGVTTGSPSASSVAAQIFENMKADRDYRHAFVEEKLRTTIAAQIRAIREQRKLSRPKLAQLMGRAASWVFRLEDPNGAPPTLSTLLQVAKAYDVDLDVKFSRFSSLIDQIDRLTPEMLEVPSFDEEIEAQESA